MSYLRALETARSHLDRGDLLAAETALADARDQWRASRFRAPLVERGLEPALRRVGGWFGRRSTRPVLPVFGHRAALLEDDLAALARLLHDEVLAVLERADAELVEADRAVLENALRLDRQSEVFSLDRNERWHALRGYLDASRRLARRVEAALLPSDLAGADDEEWLGRWCEAVLDGSGSPTPELLAWIEHQAVALGRLEGDGAATWCWIAARAALSDPVGGERALRSLQRALETGLDPAIDRRARRLLAGLLANETVLAGPGADVAEALERWRPSTPDTQWPPPEVKTVLERRRTVDPSRAVVSAAWDDDARHLVLVLHDATTPRDVLVLAPRRDEGAEGSRFEASLPEARGWIQRWMPEGALVLVASSPPAHVADLLAGHALLDVDALLRGVPADASPIEPEAPGAPHPLWNPGGGHPDYKPLARRAREIVPRLRAWAACCPAFSEDWGRVALDVMAEHGLELCGVLRSALDRVAGPAPVTDRAMQTVELVVPLQWPRLESREWPAAPGEPAAGEEALTDGGRDGCVWFDHVPTVDEIVGIASASERAEVLTPSVDRARAIAARAARRGEARRVTVAPARVGCPEVALAELDAWMRGAVGDPARQRDVLWLWRVLAESPNGEVISGSVDGDARARIVRALEQAHSTCGATCRLAGHGGCWPAQLEGRRETATVWVAVPDHASAHLDAAEDVLIDDLRAFVVGTDDAADRRRLEGIVERVHAARRAWTWARCGRLDGAVRGRWADRIGKPLVPGGSGEERAPAVLLAPPGYRPGDDLLSAEAAALIERRNAAWDAVRDERTSAWSIEGASGALAGAGPTASVDHVYTARLAREGDVDELVLLLRAGAAQAHARNGWACLDPRLASVLGHPGGTYPDVDEDRATWPASLSDAMTTAVSDGRRLFEERATRPPATWGQPITADRLRAVARAAGMEDDFEADALAEVLRDWGRGRTIVVGGATDRQRARSIDLVRALAERSGDGGPLGVRCVFVVGLATPGDAGNTPCLGPDDGDRLGAVMLEAERGRVARVDLHPDLLRDEALRAWARRVSGVAWIFPRADAVAADGSSPDALATVLAAWREVLERSGAAALIFVDAVEDEGSDELAPWAQRVDGRIAVLPAARARDRAWTVMPETVGPVTVACWRCTRSVTVDDAAARCPSCEATVMDDPGSIRAAAGAVEDLLVHRLHARSPRTWWALTSDAELASCVRERLGLGEIGADREPLLAAVAAEPDDPRILHVSELDGEVRPPAELLWLDVPAGPDEMRRVLRRLAAMEARASRLAVLVPPVGLHTATPQDLRGRWRWTAKRTEVEFRLRALDARRGDVRETIGLRPESPGPALRGAVRARRAAIGDGDAPDPRPATARVLDAIEAAGIVFGRPEARALDVGALPADVTDDDVLALLHWSLSVDVLEGTPIRAGARVATHTNFERALRAAPTDGIAAAELVRRGRETVDSTDPPPEGALRVGVARATDSWLEGAVHAATAHGERTLVVVGAATGRTRWASRLPLGAEVVAVDELAMAFLDSVAREKGIRTRTRLLPAEGTAEGEETRLRLMRETSRRYARVTGRIPALEAQDLRRAVQGESKSIPGAVAVDVDIECLDRCAAEARAEAGWLTAAELREASVNALDVEPELVERWRRRYPRVGVDGLHDLSPAMRAFVRTLFPDDRRWETYDPLLGDDPTGRAAAVSTGLDTDLPRETVRAIETLRRREPDDLGRIRARGRGRAVGRVESVRVLTLRAAADWILENVPADRAPDRTGVVVADPGDRAEVTAALRRGGLDVTIGEGTASWLADGPRQAIAALHLVIGEPNAALFDVLVRTTAGDDAKDPSARFERWQALGRGEAARDAAELRWARLHALRGEIAGTDRLRDAVASLLDAGALDPLLDLDAAAGRTRIWVEDHAHRSVDEVLSTVRPEFIADPAAPGTIVHVLAPEELVGPDHDHLISIGTGFEPIVRTVRVLLRAPQRVTLLYAERDPLG